MNLHMEHVVDLQTTVESAYAAGERNISLYGHYLAQMPGEHILRIGQSLSGLALSGYAVLDGRYITSHVVIVENAEVSINSLTIRGGDTQGAARTAQYYNGQPRRSLYESIDGAGVLILGDSSVTMRNCTIGGNHSGMCGGGLSNQGTGLVRVSDCRFLENTAFHTGGAVDNLTPGANIEIDNCQFSMNRSNVGSSVGGPHGQVTLFGQTKAAIYGCTFFGEDFPIDVQENTDVSASNNTWNSRLAVIYGSGGGHSLAVDARHVARLATFTLCHARHWLYPKVRAT